MIQIDGVDAVANLPEKSVKVTKATAPNLSQYLLGSACWMPASGPCSLETNMTVTKILDAARESAQSGRRVALTAQPPTTQ
jgi:hypothetical protein